MTRHSGYLVAVTALLIAWSVVTVYSAAGNSVAETL